MAGHHNAVLGNAEDLVDGPRMDTIGAVLLAHVAFEVYVDYAFMTLFQRSFGPLDDGWEEAITNRTFMDKATRRLWTLMTGGDDVTTPREAWKSYNAAVEFRNKVAHAGKWPTPEQARESIAAVRALIDRLEKTMEPIRAEVAEALGG